MKKNLLLFLVALMPFGFLKSQCVQTCSVYGVTSITTAPYAVTGNSISSFSPNNDDGYSVPIQIGFNFNFYCSTYSTVLIYTNGLIQFDIGAPSTFPLGYDPAQMIPNASSPTVLNGMVCFRMDDLDNTASGTISYTTIGSSPNQMFVVTYSNVPLYGNSALLYSGQIVLYEGSNMIDIYTINAPQGPNLATQGIENALGTLATAVPGRNQTIWGSTNTAYRFTWGYAPTTPTAVTGPTTLCQGDPAQYSLTAMPGATLYNWYFPAGWTGTSTTAVISSTAGSSGTVSVSASYTCGTSSAVTISVTTIPAPVVSIASATPNIFCAGKTVTFNTSGATTYTLQPGNMIGVPPFYDTPSVSTTYTLTGTNSFGCNSNNMATTFINVKQNPTVTVNSGSICLGGNFVISPSGASTYTSSGQFWTVSPTVTGTYNYSVSGTGTNGCVSDEAISTLTVVALPNINAVPTRTAICVKESTSLTASGAATYTWNTNSNNAVISVTPFISTTYSVTGTDANGCVNTKTVNLKVNPCVGISEVTLQNSITVYPNPSTGEFIMENPERVSISIYDISGKLVYTSEMQPGKNEIKLEQPPGQYFLKASNGEASGNIILIKQ